MASLGDNELTSCRFQINEFGYEDQFITFGIHTRILMHVEQFFQVGIDSKWTHFKEKLEWAASNGNRYPPYPQVMATAISQ